MEKVIETINLAKTYSKKEVVKNVNITINRGDIYGLIGKNGAGKTTIIKILSGLSKQTKGDVKLFESDNLELKRKDIGTIIENPAIYPHMTARQNLTVVMKLMNIKNNNEADRLLKLVGLSDTNKLKAGNFSLGMKQRLAIAISLVGNPKCLILDEPTNGLDPEGIKEIRELIKELNEKENITILISSHILSELSKFVTRYGIIDKGELIDEFDAQELENKSRKILKINLDNPKEAAKIIKEKFKIDDLEIKDDNTLIVNEKIELSAQINKELSKNDIMVTSINEEGTDLEGYFMELVGGEK